MMRARVRKADSSTLELMKWLLEYDTWKARGQDFFDFSAYDNVGVQWAYTSFVQPQARPLLRPLLARER